MGFADDSLDKALDRITDDIIRMSEYFKKTNPVLLSQITRASLPDRTGEKVSLESLSEKEISALYAQLSEKYDRAIREEFKELRR